VLPCCSCCTIISEGAAGFPVKPYCSFLQALEEARNAAKLCVLRFLAEVRSWVLGFDGLHLPSIIPTLSDTSTHVVCPACYA
jgi:hypothetical protein